MEATSISAFREQFGDTPFNRILEFLIVFKGLDYNLVQIARESEVAYVTSKLIIPEMLERGIIIETRMIGKARMYKANMDNPSMRAFYKFWVEVAAKDMEKFNETQKALVRVHA